MPVNIKLNSINVNGNDGYDEIEGFFLGDIRNSVLTWLNEHPDVAQNFTFPEIYGAVGDGVTPDGDAVQSALNSGKIVVGFGTYNVSRSTPYSSGTFIGIPSGAYVINCKFKFPDSSQSMNMFSGNSFTMEKCEFDMNGSNNIPTANESIYCFNIRNCNKVTFRNCHFKNSSGRNYIMVQEGKDFTLENCSFKNGGTNLSGSSASVQNDFSYCYIGAENAVINDCVILEPDANPFTYCGGFEIHGDHFVLSNCVINKCLPACYIANHHFDSNPLTDIKIINNSFLNCQGGASTFNNITVDSAEISGNYIELSPCVSSVGSVMYGVGSGTGNTHKNVLIKDNVIKEASASTYGSVGVSISSASETVISGNVFRELSNPIKLTGSNSFKNLFIKNNIAVSANTESENFILRTTSATIDRANISENIYSDYAGYISSESGITNSYVSGSIGVS